MLLNVPHLNVLFKQISCHGVPWLAFTIFGLYTFDRPGENKTICTASIEVKIDSRIFSTLEYPYQELWLDQALRRGLIQSSSLQGIDLTHPPPRGQKLRLSLTPCNGQEFGLVEPPVGLTSQVFNSPLPRAGKDYKILLKFQPYLLKN